MCIVCEIEEAKLEESARNKWMEASERYDFNVPVGWVEKQGYIPSHRIAVDGEDRIAVGDVAEKYDKIMGLHSHSEGAQVSPPPKGFFRQDSDGAWFFVVSDGKHRYSANFLFGQGRRQRQLVRWNEPTGLTDDARPWKHIVDNM